MKTEPETFSAADLAGAPRRTAAWDGVRNYQARNMLRDQMRRGDRAFLYYSSCEVPGIAAQMQIVREGYPDPTAFERRHSYYDAGSDRANPRWYAVDVRLERRLAHVITLAQLRTHAQRELKGLVLLRPGNRLSITPVTAAQWKFILTLE